MAVARGEVEKSEVAEFFRRIGRVTGAARPTAFWRRMGRSAGVCQAATAPGRAGYGGVWSASSGAPARRRPVRL